MSKYILKQSETGALYLERKKRFLDIKVKYSTIIIGLSLIMTAFILTGCTTTPPYNLAVNELINTCYSPELSELENFKRKCY